MEIVSAVKFDHDEARIISIAARSVGITYAVPSMSLEAVNAVKSLVIKAGNIIQRPKLEEAREVLVRMAEAARAQSDPAWWRGSIEKMTEAPLGQTPLVRNADSLVAAMVETRELQAREIDRALQAVNVALAYIKGAGHFSRSSITPQYTPLEDAPWASEIAPD